MARNNIGDFLLALSTLWIELQTKKWILVSVNEQKSGMDNN